MSKSKARFLAELLSSDGKVIKAKSEASTIIVGDLPTIPNSKLQNSSVTIAGEGLSLGASLTLDTADVTEHTDYKYYTNARADARIAAADTGDLSEGSNLYYTNARADARIVNAGSANWNTAYTVANAALPKAGGTLTGSIDVTGSVTADGLTVDVASGGATATAATFNNGGSGANTKARLDFLAASTRYAGISGGYGASSPEMSFDISGTDVLAINATGIDVTGTATMDGLTVNSGATNTVANFSSTDIGAYLNIADQYQTGRLNATGAVFAIEADPSNLYASSKVRLSTDGVKRLDVDSNGDISFYNDSAAQGLFWDSSASSLGIGTTSIAAGTKLQIAGETRIYPTTGTGILRFGSGGAEKGKLSVDSSSNMVLETSGATALTLDSSQNATFSGSVTADKANIGTSTAQYSGTDLTVGDNADSQNGLAIQTSTSGVGYILFGDGSGASAYRGEIKYSHSTDSMTLKTAGTNRLNLANNGDISFYNDSAAQGLFWDSSTSSLGIGTTATNILHGTNYGTTKLHIDGGTDRGQVIIQGDSVAQIVMSDNGATANSRVFITQVNDGVMNLKSVNDNGTSKATIMSMTSAGATTFSGSVTSTGLTVNATGDAALLLQSSASSQTLRLDQNSIRTTTNTPINFLTNSTPALTLSTSQNVNIPNGKIKVSATTAPVAGVDIAGNSDTVPALKIGSGDTYGHFFYDSGATGDLVIKRGAGGAQSESMRLARATGAATFSGSVTSSGTFLKTGTNGNYTIAANGNDFYYGRNGANYHIANTANGAFQFLTGSSSATGLSISSSQNVNIPNGGLMVGATTAPDSKLTVNITAAGDGIELQSNETSIAKLSRTTVGSTVVASLDGVSGRPIHVGGVVNEDVILANAGGNVGIGCVPTSPLHIKSATNVNVRFDDSGSSSYTWYMNDAQNLYIPNVQLASTHTFYAMGQRKVDIDASGNLLVGTTNNNAGGANVVGHSFGALGYISSTRDSNWVAQLNRKTNDGDIVLLKKDGSTVGSIGVMHTNNMYFTGLSGHGGLQFGTANVTPLIAGSESNGGVDLGASNLQFQNLYLSGISYVGGLYNTGIYNQQSGDIQFWVTNVGEAVRIQQNTGNLLVGTTDTDPSNNGAGGDAGHAFSSTGYISSARSEGTVALFNRMDSDGDIAAFRKDGAVVGTIGTNGGDLYFSDASYGGIKPLGDGYAVVPSTNSGADYDNAMSLGYPSIRWKDLYLSNSTIVASRTTYGAGGFWDNAANGNNTGVRTGGNQVFLTDGNGGVTDNARDLGATNRRLRDVFVGGGVYLGGTGAANKLDDYEEGTWTPIIKDGTTSGATLGISVTRAHYTKVGRMCTITAYIGRADATALTQNMIITNLPFTQDGGPQTGGVIWVDNFAADQLGMCYANDGTVLYFRSFSNTNAYILTNQFENGRALYFSRTYETT